MDSPELHALTRLVKSQLDDLKPGDLSLVACSGGADSLALAAAASRVARTTDLRVGAVVVDHQLQEGSARVANDAAIKCSALGLSPVVTVAVDVDVDSGLGLEAAARDARRAALLKAAHEHEAKALLLAHTLDDQAETVLLRLSRGSSTRSLAAMAAVDGMWRRPLLSARRAQTQALCAELGLDPHEDPHNNDDAFGRVRVRNQVIPVLVDALGESVVTNLARTAAMCRADNEALDEWAAAQADARLQENMNQIELSLDGAAGRFVVLPPAVRTRVIRLGLIAGGCPPGSLTAAHVGEVDRLACGPRGKGPTRVPGDIEVARESDKLVIYRARPLQTGTTPEEPAK